MIALINTCTFWLMNRAGTRALIAGGPPTRLGQLLLTGEVVDDEPVVPSPLRVLGAYVVSVVVRGHGTYRHADGREEPIEPRTVTVVRPGDPHWYGTPSGSGWTELFAVFSGPVFDTMSAVGVLPGSGPHPLRSDQAIVTLRTLLAASPTSRLAAEHQVMALADWLVGATERDGESGLSPAVAHAMRRLTDDLATPVNMHAVAADVGLPYDTFRRRFTAEVGQPPTSFRNTRRIEAAATLLRLTELTTREIASTLGYVDEFHLSRRFRAHFGISPRAYRQ